MKTIAHSSSLQRPVIQPTVSLIQVQGLLWFTRLFTHTSTLFDLPSSHDVSLAVFTTTASTAATTATQAAFSFTSSNHSDTSSNHSDLLYSLQFHSFKFKDCFDSHLYLHIHWLYSTCRAAMTYPWPYSLPPHLQQQPHLQQHPQQHPLHATQPIQSHVHTHPTLPPQPQPHQPHQPHPPHTTNQSPPTPLLQPPPPTTAPPHATNPAVTAIPQPTTPAPPPPPHTPAAPQHIAISASAHHTPPQPLPQPQVPQLTPQPTAPPTAPQRGVTDYTFQAYSHATTLYEDTRSHSTQHQPQHSSWCSSMWQKKVIPKNIAPRRCGHEEKDHAPADSQSFTLHFTIYKTFPTSCPTTIYLFIYYTGIFWSGLFAPIRLIVCVHSCFQGHYPNSF